MSILPALALTLLALSVWCTHREQQRLTRANMRLWKQVAYIRTIQRAVDDRLYELTPEHPTKQLLNEIDTHGVAWLRRQAD